MAQKQKFQVTLELPAGDAPMVDLGKMLGQTGVNLVEVKRGYDSATAARPRAGRPHPRGGRRARAVGGESGKGAPPRARLRFGGRHQVDHLHLHLVPRYAGTPREYWWPRLDEWPDAPVEGRPEVTQLVDDIRARLDVAEPGQ